jgi:hypothetical protein
MVEHKSRRRIMREHLRRRPRVESLESMTLLSGVSAAARGAIAALLGPVAPTSGHKIEPTGSVKGTYHVHITNPDIGKEFIFFGSGQVAPLKHVKLTGHITSPGFIYHGHSTGLLVLSDPNGSVTLAVTGPPQNGFTPIPDVFNFKITSASGKFKGDTGTGFMVLELDPAQTPTTPSGGAPTPDGEHGTFTMIFLRVAPPA